MRTTPANLPDWLNPDDYHTIVIAFPDPYGRLMGKRLTYDFFTKHVVDGEGGGSHVCNYLMTVDMEMEPLPGFELANWDKGFGDFHVKPDLATLRPLPWLDGTAIILGDLSHPDDSLVEEAPRSVLRRALERLAKSDLAAYVASELEFYLFGEDYRAACAQGYRGLTPSSDYIIDYHLMSTTRDEPVLARLRNEMTLARIPVEGTKGEWGKGQHELNLAYAEALESADRHVIFKHGAREIAQQQGRAITFMAKWSAEDAGSSCHIHISLWDREYNDNRLVSGEHPSQLFRHFLGGMLAYSRELSCLFAPTVNAYKRYRAASWAPTGLAWAYDNRTAGFRVVGNGPSLRIENRMPGADVNPYLAYSAMLLAGLKGIDERLDCGDAYEGNAYQDPRIDRLPDSLEAAVDLLDRSEMARDLFGDRVIEFYVRTARHEAAAYRGAVTDWERVRYFERI